MGGDYSSADPDVLDGDLYAVVPAVDQRAERADFGIHAARPSRGGARERCGGESCSITSCRPPPSTCEFCRKPSSRYSAFSSCSSKQSWMTTTRAFSLLCPSLDWPRRSLRACWPT